MLYMILINIQKVLCGGVADKVYHFHSTEFNTQIQRKYKDNVGTHELKGTNTTPYILRASPKCTQIVCYTTIFIGNREEQGRPSST